MKACTKHGVKKGDGPTVCFSDGEGTTRVYCLKCLMELLDTHLDILEDESTNS